MKKLFLLIPAMLLTVMAYATSQTISPSSEESDSNIRSALSGSADTIMKETIKKLIKSTSAEMQSLWLLKELKLLLLRSTIAIS